MSTAQNTTDHRGRFAYLRTTEVNGIDELELVTGIEPNIGIGVGYFLTVEAAREYAAGKGWPTADIVQPS